jgi:hypothetical protein
MARKNEKFFYLDECRAIKKLSKGILFFED